MINKKVLTIFGVVILGSLLVKAFSRLAFPMPVDEYSPDIFSLMIGLILITSMGILIKQKNWRILCLLIGVDSIILQLAPMNTKELTYVLYPLVASLAVIGFLNLRLFYKSEFIILNKSKSSLIALMAVILIIIAIFMFFASQ